MCDTGDCVLFTEERNIIYSLGNNLTIWRKGLSNSQV